MFPIGINMYVNTVVRLVKPIMDVLIVLSITIQQIITQTQIQQTMIQLLIIRTQKLQIMLILRALTI